MKCKFCGKQFKPRAVNHYFCSEKCKYAYWKIELRKRYHSTKKNPQWICGNCGFINQLSYNPLKKSMRFLDEKCKKCGEPRIEHLNA